MQRTRDAALIDAIAQPLWRWVAEDGQEFTTLEPWLADERNIAWANDVGAFLGSYQEPGTYEVHTLFGRGKGAPQSAQDAMFRMYTETDAVELVTKCPQSNPLARRLAERMGFSRMFTGGKWRSGGKVWPIDYMRHSIEDWMRDEELLPILGEQFHRELQELGVEPDHEHDPVHDRYVGAAYAMMMGGQPGKARVYYNRWARFYGYAPIRIISADPLIVDIKTCVLRMEGGTLCLSEQQ